MYDQSVPKVVEVVSLSVLSKAGSRSSKTDEERYQAQRNYSKLTLTQSTRVVIVGCDGRHVAYSKSVTRPKRTRTLQCWKSNQSRLKRAVGDMMSMSDPTDSDSPS